MDTLFLLIDISNSFTKLVAATPTELTPEVHRLATPELSVEVLLEAAGPPDRYRCVVLSSVVPRATEVIRAYLGRSSEPPRLLEVSHRVNLGIEMDYPSPETIGADRLANAVAAAVYYGAPSVVVDFGTALTFDVLTGGVWKSPAYAGGVIAPGLEAMTHYLHQRTALLPKIDLDEPTAAIGKSTRDAMLAGAIYGYRGLVREILSAIGRELGASDLHVVATGGYAQLIADRMPEITAVHPRLTLEGLRIIARLN